MAMGNVPISSDVSRRLPTASFVEGSQITIDIPRDTVFKHLALTISGSVVTTFASGTPVSDDTAFMNRVVNYIDIVSQGSFTIKNVSPWAMRMQSLLATGQPGVRRSSAGASASVYPTVDAGFTYGSTTNLTSCVESILISFECVLAGKGRMSTLWDTRGLASAEMKISTNTFLNTLSYGNTAPVVYSSNTFIFSVETVENQSFPQNIYFSAFKQTTKQVSFSAQVTDQLVDINRGNFLMGLQFEARDGASGSATTNTGKLLSNTLITDLKLIINGVNYVQNNKFLDLQNKNITRYGLNVPMASNKSLLDGVAYMDLLTPAAGEKYGAVSSAQDVRAPQVDQVQLSVSTYASATYTSVASLKIMTNEIVQPAVQS